VSRYFLPINVRTVNNIATHLLTLAGFAFHQRLEIEGGIKEMNVQIKSKTEKTLLWNN
jgi:hypothetical protein